MRGGIGRESAVYTEVNEHFEPDANEAGRPSAACNTVGLESVGHLDKLLQFLPRAPLSEDFPR